MVLPVNNAATALVAPSSNTTAPSSTTSVSPETASLVIAYNREGLAQTGITQVSQDLGVLGEQLQSMESQMSAPNASVTQFQVTTALTLEQQLAEASRNAAAMSGNSINQLDYGMTTLFYLGPTAVKI